MDPEHAAWLEEVHRFKRMYGDVKPGLRPDLNCMYAFPRLSSYVKRHGYLPALVYESESDDSSEEEEEEENNIVYLSDPEFEDDDDDDEEDPEEEEEDPEENEDGEGAPPPVFVMDELLAEYEAIEAEEADPPANPPPEPEPESEVDDPVPISPSPPRASMMLPTWAPWHGHLADLEPNTFCYIEIAPVYPISWKAQCQRFYMGPVRILEACKDNYYTVDVPEGYASVFSNKALFVRVYSTRPVDEHRIISLDLDFTDQTTYTEVPIYVEEHIDPRGTIYLDKRWNVTWRCYGLTEVTVERESRMREYFPWMF